MTFKRCVCSGPLASLTEHAGTARAHERHILPLALVQAACSAAWKMCEKQNKVLRLGNATLLKSSDLKTRVFLLIHDLQICVTCGDTSTEKCPILVRGM